MRNMMKKILFLSCVLLLFTSTVYANDINAQDKMKENIFETGLYNTNYISIDRIGQIAYIINEDEINALMIMLEDILNHNDFSQRNIEDQKNELKPVADYQYRISLYTNDEEEKRDMMFFIYKSGEFDVMVNDTETGKLWIQDEELSQLINFVETLFEKQCKYDTFLQLNTTNLTKLGSVLDGKVYVFENAFIDSQGCLYISMEDWDAIFSPTYGNTKKLSVRNGEIMYDGEMTGVQSKEVGECVYLPLRKTVDFFKYFTLEWDAKLRKIILFEKAE